MPGMMDTVQPWPERPDIQASSACPAMTLVGTPQAGLSKYPLVVMGIEEVFEHIIHEKKKKKKCTSTCFRQQT
jgi:hypothetical protein